MNQPTFSIDDTRYMARAIQLARQGLYTTHPNPRVGCVIVLNGEVVGEGWHQIAGQGHAEVNALAQAGGLAYGATAYVTLEPCSHHGRTPPCSQTLIDAGISRVVSAMQDPNPLVSGNGHQMLLQAGVDVTCGLLGAESEQLNPGFIKRMSAGLPWVRVKSAMSADGRTAMASGESRWITGPEARQEVQRLRARSEAIITGVESVLIDDPSLTVRPSEWQKAEAQQSGIASENLADGSLKGLSGASLNSDYQWPAILADAIQPLRVILDSNLRTPPSANILKQPGKTLIVCVKEHPERQRALALAGADVLCLPADSPEANSSTNSAQPRVDLLALLKHLATRDVNEVLIESGAVTAGAFMQQGLVDEWTLFVAPALMGSDARPVLTMPGIETMNNKIALTMVGVKQVGNDLRIDYALDSRFAGNA